MSGTNHNGYEFFMGTLKTQHTHTFSHECNIDFYKSSSVSPLYYWNETAFFLISNVVMECVICCYVLFKYDMIQCENKTKKNVLLVMFQHLWWVVNISNFDSHRWLRSNALVSPRNICCHLCYLQHVTLCGCAVSACSARSEYWLIEFACVLSIYMCYFKWQCRQN